ncbi:MAG: DUF5990 family protein [Chitinophagaceae bacterium]
MESIVTLQIILNNPPSGVLFGLQKGSGSNYETIQNQMSGSGDLTFAFAVGVKGDKSKDDIPKLTGPFVQGPAGGRFVYIDIGTYAGQLNTVWSRRLKVPLSGITWDFLGSLTNQTVLQTTVPGTGKDGGPNCATVKPFAGWVAIR